MFKDLDLHKFKLFMQKENLINTAIGIVLGSMMSDLFKIFITNFLDPTFEGKKINYLKNLKLLVKKIIYLMLISYILYRIHLFIFF